MQPLASFPPTTTHTPQAFLRSCWGFKHHIKTLKNSNFENKGTPNFFEDVPTTTFLDIYIVSSSWYQVLTYYTNTHSPSYVGTSNCEWGNPVDTRKGGRVLILWRHYMPKFTRCKFKTSVSTAWFGVCVCPRCPAMDWQVTSGHPLLTHLIAEHKTRSFPLSVTDTFFHQQTQWYPCNLNFH